MKRYVVCFLSVLIFFLTGLGPSFASSETLPANSMHSTVSQGERLAEEISNTVGISISPLLGMAALGGWHWYKTPEAQRDSLPWHQQPVFWGPLLIILGLIVFKDGLKTLGPVPKQVFAPVDAIEALLNKGGGVLGLLVVLAGLSAGENPALVEAVHNSFQALFSSFQPVSAMAAEAGSGNSVGAVWLFFTGIVLSFCFVVVWLVSHAIDVLILLSPFAFVDMLLKMARNTLLAILVGANLISPWFGLIFALAIVVVAWFLAGKAFRLMVFGTVFIFDVLFRRNVGMESDEEEVYGFTGAAIPDLPRLTYGRIRLEHQDKIPVLKFSWKPWLVMPAKTIVLSRGNSASEVGMGFFSPVIMRPQDNDGVRSKDIYFRLRPRYKGNEVAVASLLQIVEIQDVSFGKGMKAIFNWFQEERA